MIFGGTEDGIFPGQSTSDKWRAIFAKLGSSAVVKMDIVQANVGHVITDNAFSNLRRFVGDEDNYVENITEGANFLTASFASTLVLGALAYNI